MDFPRILVLGATGRLGAMLRRRWPAGQGLWQARPDAQTGQSAPQSTPRVADQGADWLRLDPLSDSAALAAAAERAAAILCLAGVTPAAAARGADLGDNAALGLAAVRAGAKGNSGAGAPVLLASSAAVYGAQGGLLSEAARLAPVNDYGRAKAEMEIRAAALGAELGVPVTSLRIGNVAGADAILGGWRPGFTLDRFADGRTPRRSYIGPASLADVLAALAGRAARRGDLPGCLNIAAPGTVEMGALLDAAGLVWTPRPAPAGAIPEVALDVAALGRLVALDPAAGTAEKLVAEWRALAQKPAP
ncbi:NAD-dependent epimerase/dehydratase family protein [Antarcticimicrobium luteum]|uniref:NAD(P)-dependent oxidoreductase n=1 Tax=Antarcticimicrobium luteum TaxID=2547397 RepID=A0A4R5VF66_9RHOB|nr:NAD(P)-dependent oxidoreductase [Antarcticimicrobium luteum]TDK50878.1 NAD(P)-dependent oxidoreductase [Antarcticimicrobium luteum]